MGDSSSPLVAAATGTTAGNPYILNAASNAAGLGSVTDKLGSKGPLSGWIGQAGGAGGTGFAAPEGANIQQGTSVQDVQNAQAGAANSLESQQRLLSALQAQNGLGQQNNVGSQQNALYNQLQAANGIGTQNSAISGLQNTAGMYQNVASGQGPNPAMAMLNQATGANVANQASLMAGQRGAGSNVGLMARQAAQQGAATQQQAAGQAATMQANQQLNALSGLAGTQQAIGGLGGQQLAAQQAQQQAQAGQANLIAGQQIAGTTANTQANLTNQQQMQGSLQGINQSNVASQGNVNSGNAGLAQTQMGAQQGLFGGAMNGLGAAIGAAKGGVVPHYAQGDIVAEPMVAPAPVAPVAPVAQAPQPASGFGQFLKGWSGSGGAAADGSENNMGSATGGQQINQGMTNLGKAIGKAKAKQNAAPAEVEMATGGLANTGGHVKAKNPSQKPEKSGNSYDNDKVPAMLSEGEIVLPRSVTMAKDPILAAGDFVRSVLAKRGAK